MINYIYVVISAVIIAVVFYISHLENEIEKLNLTIDNQKTQIKLCGTIKDSLVNSIDELNRITETQKIDYDNKVKEFDEYKKHPKVITILKDINLTTEDCNEIKSTLDDISTINYSDL